MSWLKRTLWSSIGKKLMMAVTGLSFCGFLTVHLAGNFTLYAGPDAFNSYARRLHSYGPLLSIAELGLLLLALAHVLTGATLFYQNFKSRPVRYAVNHRAGGRTIGSATMPYTGYLLLIFVIIHLSNFHFVDKTDTTIFQIVSDAFSHPGYVALYVLAMMVAAIHVSHGVWSAFQTIGANQAKYMPAIRIAGIVFSLAVGIGFGLIPLYFSVLS